MQTKSLLGPGGSPSFANVAIAAGGTFDLYNTADQTTNYERLRAEWSGNIARFYVQSSGTGIDRDFRVGTSTLYHQYQQRTGTSPFVSFINAASASTNATGLNQLYSGSVFAASGTQIPVSIAPTINQSGTAGYTALDINPTETATGSGTKLLQRWAVGGSALAQMTNGGNLALANVIATNQLGFSSGLGVSIDVALTRDAADTPALRRSTNPQTFRVYNTYTDASNYERGIVGWNSNNFDLSTSSAGTGAARALRLYTGGNADLAIGTNGSMRWIVNTAGHFLANADNTYDIGASGANRPRNLYVGTSIVLPTSGAAGTGILSGLYALADGITAPGATVGQAKLYVDTADGDLKIIFGDGTIKTIVTDT